MASVSVKLDMRVLEQIKKQVGDRPVETRTIRDGTEYGLYVELGTERMTARPALVPAVERVKKVLLSAIGPAVERGEDLNAVFWKAAFLVEGWYKAEVPVDTGTLKNSITVD